MTTAVLLTKESLEPISGKHTGVIVCVNSTGDSRTSRAISFSYSEIKSDSIFSLNDISAAEDYSSRNYQ